MEAVDLEIGLHHRDAKEYRISLRFSRPDSTVDDQVESVVQFEFDQLRALSLDASKYGKRLGEYLFASQEIRTTFDAARKAAETLDVALRMRLFISSEASELQSLRWETLRDPSQDRCLLTDEHLLFSRYLSSSDWRSAPPQPQTALRAVVVIANPSNIAEYNMAAVDVTETLKRTKSGLGNIPVTALTSGGTATLENLITHLRDGYDILYLVGHGRLLDGEPRLWLEDETGKTQMVSGTDFVTQLRELEQRPRLVVLASCQSAGMGDEARAGDEGALAALGPRLAEAGIPAVIAMQGNITINTIDAFLPVFFRELQRDGRIDRAMAVARGAVRERFDWWMPVLFMRLKDGRLWPITKTIHQERAGATPHILLQLPPPVEHFTDREHELEKLLQDLQPGRVVTLCGPGGIGKTALASVAIRSLLSDGYLPDRFPDGILFHSFYGRPDVNLALEHIATSFGIEPKPTPAIAALQVLAGKHALLILDGTEEAKEWQSVLKVRGECGVLVTSRTKHDATAERQDIPPLQPDNAVELLRAWGGDRTHDEAAAKRICELVGGLPLALRLVGRYLSETREQAAEYLEWLQDQPITALDRGKHREESVSILLSRSVEQVSEAAQQVLAVVGQLALQPFAVEPVAAALDCEIRYCRSALGELVSYGLLLRPGDRYEVSHALIHTYARRRMTVDPEALHRLAEYYERFAREQREQGLEGYARLDAERTHIMQVIEHCQEQQRWQAVSDLAGAITTYLDRQGYWTDSLSGLEMKLFAAQQQKDRKDEGWCLNSLGETHRKLGDYARALAYLEQSLAIFREIGDKAGEGTTLNNIGRIYRARGDNATALQYYEQSLAITREIGDKAGEGTTCWNIGLIYRDQGDLEKAEAYISRTVELKEKIGHPDLEQYKAELEDIRKRRQSLEKPS